MDYAVSDLHGYLAGFLWTIETLITPSDTLYIMGDAIDRNSGGIYILREVRAWHLENI